MPDLSPLGGSIRLLAIPREIYSKRSGGERDFCPGKLFNPVGIVLTIIHNHLRATRISRTRARRSDIFKRNRTLP